jgi:predicted transcriptional regulator
VQEVVNSRVLTYVDSMASESVHYVRGRALRALDSARRLELVEALMSEQPATVEELGRHLGRDPKTLYHHLRPLLKAGLVEEDGQRPTSKRPATVYRLPADRLELDPDEDSAQMRQARLKIARSALRGALRLQERAIDNPGAILGGPRRTVLLCHRVVRLTARGRARVIRKMRELYDVLGQEHDERGEPIAVTMSLAPVSREP